VQEGRASTTARLVTAARLRSPREHVDGGRPDDDERLARDVAGDLVDRPTMLERHLVARTRFVDRVVVRALDDGIPQVVLAGAGYDGRALRYARPGVRWFDLDHPDTQRDMRARLARLGIAAPGVGEPMLSALSADEADALLAGAGWQPDAGLDPAARAQGFLLAVRAG
jgi:O-methyltransferase involved in polyketide biosynthesis